MKLDKKKELASRALKIGKKRISFNENRLEELKEVITKQDIHDLLKAGVIKVKEKKGRRKVKKRKTKKRDGKIKKKINRRKKDYATITKKLRKYISELKNQGKITYEQYIDIRKKIRTKEFRSKAHLKEVMELK